MAITMLSLVNNGLLFKGLLLSSAGSIVVRSCSSVKTVMYDVEEITEQAEPRGVYKHHASP